MATATVELMDPAPPPTPGFFDTPTGRNFAWGVAIAVVLALMFGTWMWSQQPVYKVLFANFSDRDGGAIVTALQQQNIPYKLAEGGGAILVPAEQVHDVRLKLASQGLPKGGNVGFELMENQKLGISQFLEQVNFQRAQEGELARSIQSLSAVQSARIHLALPKPSVFIRDQQKPTASVILNLHPGRTLDQAQVGAIIHLVASSIPELHSSNVTVVDQNGSLLSELNKNSKSLDPNQLKYVQQLQLNIIKQVESIIIPMVGQNNVRAEATADVDFSQVEQAAESYKPNQPPATASVRSQQTSESQTPIGGGPSGVPGALTNQPPTPATAPITTIPEATGTPTAGTTTTVNGNTRKDSTTNFEVDKTISYTQQGMGGVRRLSVAVIVNYKRMVDKKGKVTIKALSDTEKTQITNLVKEAMGFNEKRGDTLSVLNTPFDGVDKPDPVPVPIPWWKDRENIELAKELGRIALFTFFMGFLFFKLLLPLLRPVTRKFDEWVNPPKPEEEKEEEKEEEVAVTEEEAQQQAIIGEIDAKLHQGYRENLQLAKQMAKDDPRVVANVVKAWVGTNE
jgi:flagellar M-ring protein FliF